MLITVAAPHLSIGLLAPVLLSVALIAIGAGMMVDALFRRNRP